MNLVRELKLINSPQDKVVGPRTLERRRAVVMMTNGADNAFLGFGNFGSKTELTDLIETVRRDDTLIVPIYLDTEGSDETSRKVYVSARRTFELLADESSMLHYKARKFEELSGVYAQVI